MSVQDDFPDLFYDVKFVEEKTPKALPSIAQVVGAVLIKNGSNNPGLASQIAAAVEQLVALKAGK